MATPKKTSTKTTTAKKAIKAATTATKRAVGKAVPAEQLTLVDVLPMVTEPPAVAAPEPASRATRASGTAGAGGADFCAGGW